MNANTPPRRRPAAPAASSSATSSVAASSSVAATNLPFPLAPQVDTPKTARIKELEIVIKTLMEHSARPPSLSTISVGGHSPQHSFHNQPYPIRSPHAMRREKLCSELLYTFRMALDND
jgi:hypothetical protein